MMRESRKFEIALGGGLEKVKKTRLWGVSDSFFFLSSSFSVDFSGASGDSRVSAGSARLERMLMLCEVCILLAFLFCSLLLFGVLVSTIFSLFSPLSSLLLSPPSTQPVLPFACRVALLSTCHRATAPHVAFLGPFLGQSRWAGTCILR